VTHLDDGVATVLHVLPVQQRVVEQQAWRRSCRPRMSEGLRSWMWPTVIAILANA
jgi:hypothetical protein